MTPLALALSLLFQFSPAIPTSKPDNAVRTVCVNPTTHLLESCAGGGAGGVSDVNLFEYGGVAVGAANALHIQPGAGASFAVTGTFFQATQPISAAALPLPSGAATSALQTQPGVDIGDVTINNAAGAAAVNVQDGGNSLTVDGSVTATQATGTNLHTVVDSGTITTVGTVTTVSTVSALTSITNVVHVDDNSGSLTVDAPVGTPVFTRLSDGAAALIGQKAMAASIPVVMASDQAKFPIQFSQTTTDNDVDVASIAAGSNIIGNVRIDQTTPGTTNGVRADTSGATGSAVPARAEYQGLNDGTNTRGAVAASATNLTTATIVGLQLTSATCTWNKQHTPATATKATISQAAVASTRHVMIAFTACVSAGGTAQTPLTLQIRDGATGAGTIVWSAACSAAVNTTCCVSNTGMPLTGTANTAFTIEWSAAGVAASQETVSMCGFDVT